MKITLNPQKKYQTFKSIGASGAWWAQAVGDWSHTDPVTGESMRDAIARLLYNKETGIGMGVYRYNIGAGSAHSGNGNYSQPLRRTQCFERAPGDYDWSRDTAAVYMMEKCVENGADEVVFFVNSPLERLTKNNCAHNDKNQLFHENIKKSNYGEFARYCFDVAEHFINKGIPVKYLSPVNEPIWVWNGGQEGCFYRPRSVKKVFKVFAKELESRDLKGLKLSGAEAGDLRWFNKSYTRQLLKDKNVRKHLDSVDVHSYFLSPPKQLDFPFLRNRLAFVNRFRKFMERHYPDMPIVMSEWTHMQGGRDRTMKSALVMAQVMYEDFTFLNAVSWQHWIAVSEVDYCDGLIYINLEDKTYEMTKRYYATGNFSRYLKKGAVRIEVSSDDEKVLPLAFCKDDEVTLILINKDGSEKEFALSAVGEILCAVTDNKDNLKEFKTDGGKVRLTAQSITTFVYKISGTDI